MALVNAFGYVLLEEELYDKSYVARFTEGLEAYRQTVKDYAPEKVEHLTGIPARDVRRDAHVRGGSFCYRDVGNGRDPVWSGR